MAIFLALFLAGFVQVHAPAAPVAVVQFELYHNRVYLPVMVNGAGPFHVILDTGAGMSGLNQARTRELALNLKGKAQLRGNGESLTSVRLAKDVSFKVGSAELEESNIAVIAFDDLERHEGRPVDGVLGAELFRRYVVEIDYASRTLALYAPENYSYSGTGEVLSFQFKYGWRLGLIRGSIQMPGQAPLDAYIAIDSGTYSAVRLYRPFVEKHQLLSAAGNTVSSFGFGMGGEFKEVMGRVQVLQFGKLKIEQPVTSFSVAAGGYTATETNAGSIGGEILRRFKVILDYSRKQIILEPNAEFNQPFAADMSGLTLLAEGADLKTIKVDHVAEGSPAAQAGIHEGDVIAAIDEKSSAGLGLAGIQELLKHEQTYRVTLQRGSETLTVQLHTRKLI